MVSIPFATISITRKIPWGGSFAASQWYFGWFWVVEIVSNSIKLIPFETIWNFSKCFKIVPNLFHALFVCFCPCLECLSNFNLSEGCFGTDIIQNCTKWSDIIIHGLSFRPIFAKFHCASFLLWKNEEKWHHGPKKHKHVVLREKTSLRSYMPHTKVGKTNVPI